MVKDHSSLPKDNDDHLFKNLINFLNFYNLLNLFWKFSMTELVFGSTKII